MSKIEQALEEYGNEVGTLLAQVAPEELNPITATHLVGSMVLAGQLKASFRAFIDKRIESQNMILDAGVGHFDVARNEAEAYRKLYRAFGEQTTETTNGVAGGGQSSDKHQYEAELQKARNNEKRRQITRVLEDVQDRASRSGLPSGMSMSAFTDYIRSLYPEYYSDRKG